MEKKMKGEVKKMIKKSEVKDMKEDKKMMGNKVLKDKMKKKDCKY
jgi:hypothetical protein